MVRIPVTLALLLTCGWCFAAEDETGVLPTISHKTAGMTKHSGYFDFYWDEKAGKVWLEIDRWNTEFLYVHYLSAGLGSNDVGLDRGQIGDTRIVYFKRVGPKVLLVQPNYGFRANTENPAETQAVEEAFAQSVVGGFTIEAESGTRVLVDATDFFLRDAHDVVGRLKENDQGSFSLDQSRSAVNLNRTKNFPDNTEFDATLTFQGEDPGQYVRQVAPDPNSLTIRQRHSFVKLPESGYEPREFDPRSGSFSINFMDFGTPIDQPIEKRFLVRHRLEKKNPRGSVSEPVEPIVYYLDPGTPEPVRSALLEGARWWNQAFEQAGYRDAFQVRMLPEDADPLDVRYNVIQWVHRATRGWSYGSSVVDPRTGEIIKGHVTLGSLRVRQDFLIAQGLLGPYEEEDADTSELTRFSLARLRQLSAHEVGHTLGFAHNFASSVSNRASVMDYPHPMVKLDSYNNIDLSEAYDTGIGEWDNYTVRYAYQDFPEGMDAEEVLNGIVTEAIAEGLQFISDRDARPMGGAHPTAHLWDNGEDAVQELEHVLKVRETALDRFSEDNIPYGQPLSSLEEVLVPIYLFHRYQVEAAAKVLGGLEYTYAVRGDEQIPTKMVDAEWQRRALDALLETIDAETLTLPEHVVELIPPRAYGTYRHRETFNIRTGVALDPVAMAETAAGLTVTMLVHPMRAARLIEFHGRDDVLPGFDEVLTELIDATWKSPPAAGLEGEVHRAVNNVVLRHLLNLAANGDAAPQVRATAHAAIDALQAWLILSRREREWRADDATLRQFEYAVSTIERYREEPKNFTLTPSPDLPPGSPIGMPPELACGW